jgi:fluoroacetyl-CoA thioesterase
LLLWQIELKKMSEIVVGIVGENTELVTAENTAARWGSGLVAGYSTPAMVALMENAAFNATKDILPVGQTTVGVEVHIKHLAATPVGMTVRARAELTHVDGRKLTFSVEAWDDVEKIGEGTHQRFVVDLDRFETRFQEKRAKAGLKT